MKYLLRCGFLAAGLTAAAPPASFADDKDVIEYRQHIMKTLDEQTAIIGMIVSSAAPEENLKFHTEAIALAASIALKSFEPKVPGGEANPNVWAKWTDFSARMSKMAENTKKLDAAAKGGAGPGEITSILVEALPCKECHDLYRDEKK